MSSVVKTLSSNYIELFWWKYVVKLSSHNLINFRVISHIPQNNLSLKFCPSLRPVCGKVDFPAVSTQKQSTHIVCNPNSGLEVHVKLATSHLVLGFFDLCVRHPVVERLRSQGVISIYTAVLMCLLFTYKYTTCFDIIVIFRCRFSVCQKLLNIILYTSYTLMNISNRYFGNTSNVLLNFCVM
jgi:hypothetical protein